MGLFDDSRSLMENGYFLVQADPEQLFTGRALYNQYLNNIPEIREGAVFDGDKGAGGFGALNYASSYHSEAKRFMDYLSYETALYLITGVAAMLGLGYFQGIPDRCFNRTKKQPKESYHTDNTAGADKTDVFYGSALNMNEDIDQVFTLVPGSHQNSASTKGGDFTPLTPTDELLAREIQVVIPPGFILVFNENIVHRISGKKPKKTILRNGLGFRITDSEISWAPDNFRRLAEQSPLIHKGGEIAPMYPKLWKLNWPDHCEKYSAKLIPEMVTTHTYQSGKQTGRTFNIPHKEAPSLTILGKRYRDRTEEENRIFKIRCISE